MDIADELNSAILDSEIEIECPTCNRGLSIKLNQVGKVVQCPFCKTNIELKSN